MTERDADRPRQRRPKRYGVRTLGYLALAAASVLTSNALAARGIDDYVLLTFLGTMVGLSGAAVCSYRGLRSSRGWFPKG